MLKPGRRVEALVKFVGNNEARCVLPELDNLEATLSSSDISSQGPVIPSDHLKVGQSVSARFCHCRFLMDLSLPATPHHICLTGKGSDCQVGRSSASNHGLTKKVLWTVLTAVIPQFVLLAWSLLLRTLGGWWQMMHLNGRPNHHFKPIGFLQRVEISLPHPHKFSASPSVEIESDKACIHVV